MRRMGRPGLVGTVARTAVIAGTATAVSNKVSQNQYEKQVTKQEAAAYEQQQAAAAQQAQIDAQVQAALAAQAAQQQALAAAAPPPAPAAPAGGTDIVAELQKLADLKAQGILSDEEFAAAKAKLIG
ncbi:MAG: SHOCT domain-containing protein [Candidatus Nanopelagicales bacterium]